MKVALLNTYDIRGGAARAAYRLNKGLIQIGVDVKMFVRDKISNDDSVSCVIPMKPLNQFTGNDSLNLIQQYYINQNRTECSNTIFTLPYPGIDLTALDVVKEADIINLHWVSNFQSPVTLRRLFSLGKPVIWTLHDQWAFTGGCHYTAGCDKYKTDCSCCPQLADNPYDLTNSVLKDKLDSLNGANITIVTPSRWLSICAIESKLFKGFRVETIANSIETEIFKPMPKEDAKEQIGVSKDTLTILVGAEHGNAKRKGFREFIEAIRYCIALSAFKNIAKKNKVMIICFGNLSDELYSLGIPIVSLGYLKSDEKIREAYCAADIFALPSLEDNLPNTMLESMSCGTPVIAFNTGGMPDLIEDQKTGLLVPCRDTQGMGAAISDILFKEEKRKRMGENCRKVIEDEYSISVQAKHYLELFHELLKNKNTSTTSNLNEIASMRNIGNGMGTQNINIETNVGENFKEIYKDCLQHSIKIMEQNIVSNKRGSEELKAQKHALRYLLKNKVAMAVRSVEKLIQMGLRRDMND